MKQHSLVYKLVLILLCVVLLVGGVLLYQVFYGPNTFDDASEKTFIVWKGEPFASIVDSLAAQGIIRDRAWFVFVAKVVGGTQRIQVGKYVFASGISNIELYDLLREGRPPISVTIPEGILSRAQTGVLARKIGLDSTRFVNLVNDEQFAHALGIPAPSLEGYLLPETYSLHWQTDEKEVITRMVEHFQQFYTDSLQERAKELGLTTNQVVTLASIVEGEAILDEERATISGVYHNRLRKRMRLEADPTVQYLIEDGPRRILHSDLQVNSPYNTYRYFGLPPGPINNPGKASILAALFPEQNKYLFFVANGSGGHRFATNFNDHLRNTRLYRRGRLKSQSQSLSQVPR